MSNSSKGHEEFKNFCNRDVVQVRSMSSSAQNQMSMGSTVFGNGDGTGIVNLDSFSAAKGSGNPKLPCFNVPFDRLVHSKYFDDNSHANSRITPKILHFESYNPNRDSVNASWSNSRNSPKMLIHNDKDNWARVTGGFYTTPGSGIKIHNLVGSSTCTGNMGETSNPNFPLLHSKSIISHQLSGGTPFGAPDNNSSLNLHGKAPYIGSGLTDHERLSSRGFSASSGLPASLKTTSSGYPTLNLTSMLHQTPSLLRKDGTSENPYLRDENLRTIALRQISELSRQQHDHSSLGINQQHSDVEPMVSGVRRHVPDIANEDVSDVVFKSLRCQYDSRSCNQYKRLDSVTGNYNRHTSISCFYIIIFSYAVCLWCLCHLGLYNWPNCPTISQGAPSQFKRTEIQLTHQLNSSR